MISESLLSAKASSVNEGQSLKTPYVISFTLAGMVMLFRLVQPENVPEPSFCRSAGKRTSSRLLQPLKVPCNSVMPSGSETDFSAVQPWKEKNSPGCTCRTTEVTSVLYLNISSSTSVTLYVLPS